MTPICCLRYAVYPCPGTINGPGSPVPHHPQRPDDVLPVARGHPPGGLLDPPPDDVVAHAKCAPARAEDMSLQHARESPKVDEQDLRSEVGRARKSRELSGVHVVGCRVQRHQLEAGWPQNLAC